MKKHLKHLTIAAAGLMLSIGVVATAGATPNDPTPGFDPAPEGHTVTFCHVAGLASDPANLVTITADEHAVFGQAGHFDENGTPNAGHEQDYLGPCEEPEEPELEEVSAAVELTDGDCESAPFIAVDSKEGVVYTVDGVEIGDQEVPYMSAGAVHANDQSGDDNVLLVGQTEWPFTFSFDPSSVECEDPEDPENPEDPEDPEDPESPETPETPDGPNGSTATTNSPDVDPAAILTSETGDLPETL